ARRDGRVAAVDAEIGLALRRPRRRGDKEDASVPAVEKAQDAHCCRTGLDRDHPRAQRPERADAIADMRADVEGEPARGHERPVEPHKPRMMQGPQAVDRDRAEDAEQFGDLHRPHSMPSFARTNCCTACGLALPPVPFITCPTNQPAMLGLAFACSALSGLAAMTWSTAASMAPVSVTWRMPRASTISAGSPPSV